MSLPYVLLNFLQVLKLYAWEMIFKDKIADKRNVELKKQRNLKVLERIMETFSYITTFLVRKLDHALYHGSSFACYHCQSMFTNI
jgi:hypothetical protein